MLAALFGSAQFLLLKARVAALRRASAGRPQAAPARRHVMLMAWTFLPFQSTGVFVPASLVRDAGLNGWRVSVVTGPYPAQPPKSGEDALKALPSSVKIVRTGFSVSASNELRFHPASRLMPAVDGGYHTALAMVEAGLRSARQDPPSIILASGPRFANFVAAARLHDYLGRKPRLIFHYRDEWTVQTQGFVRVTADDRRWEEECLRRADAAIFVTEGKRRAYLDAFAFLKPERCFVVRNGWDKAVFGDDAPHTHPSRSTGEAFTIAFVGRAAQHTPLPPFLQALSTAVDAWPELRSRLRLRVVGRQMPNVLAQLESFAKSHPGIVQREDEVSPSAAAAIASGSDAVLLLTNTAYSGIVPLKTFDYMRSNTPILAFGRSSEAAEIVTRTGAGLVVDETSPASLVDILKTFLSAPRAQFCTSERAAWVAANRRDVLNQDMLKIFGTAEDSPRAAGA